MIYEVFMTTTGATIAYVEGMDAVRAITDRIGGSDYEPAPKGFFVVDMAGFVKRDAPGRAGWLTADGAEHYASMLNMGSDNNSYHVAVQS